MTSSPAASAVSAGLVFTGTAGLGSSLPAALNVYDKDSGAVLASFPQAGSVSSGVALVGGAIYFGTGNSYDGAGSSVQAYALPDDQR